MHLLRTIIPQRQYINGLTYLKNKKQISHDMQKAGNVAIEIEQIFSVLYNLRSASLFNIKKGLIKKYLDRFKKLNLKHVILSEVYCSSYNFAHYSMNDNSNKNAYKVVVSKSIDTLNEFKQAFYSMNNRAIGKILGYPEDCCHFFENMWNVGCFDPLWHQAINTLSDDTVNGNTLQFKKDNVFNLTHSFLRYLNIRLTSHIPCSLKCNESYRIAKERLELGKSLNLVGIDELEWILGLSIKWSVHNGKAYIKTPFFEFLTDSIDNKTKLCIAIY